MTWPIYTGGKIGAAQKLREAELTGARPSCWKPRSDSIYSSSHATSGCASRPSSRACARPSLTRPNASSPARAASKRRGNQRRRAALGAGVARRVARDVVKAQRERESAEPRWRACCGRRPRRGRRRHCSSLPRHRTSCRLAARGRTQESNAGTDQDEGSSRRSGHRRRKIRLPAAGVRVRPVQSHHDLPDTDRAQLDRRHRRQHQAVQSRGPRQQGGRGAGAEGASGCA